MSYYVGSFGSESDSDIFRNTAIAKSLERGDADLPSPEPVYGSNDPVPYCFIGDAAFPLRKYLMIPYGGRNLSEQQFLHNKELSRGRVVIENTFGVLAARWLVLLKTIAVHPKNVDKIVLATVALHNFMLSNARRIKYFFFEFNIHFEIIK